MKLIISLIALLIVQTVFAQAPNNLTYQAVIRDMNDDLSSNSNIGLQVSILQGSSVGTPVYVETHSTITNQNGLMTILIGDGTIISGDFNTIPWANGPFFIKTETDLQGGANYSLTATSQFLSVPYALYAETSGSSTPGPIGATGPAGADGATGPAGTDGTNGNDGLSAYAIWINNGNAGTETDFLNWLQSPAGTDDQNLAEVLTENNYGNMIQIKEIADPTDPQDAVTKAYVDLLEARLDSLIGTLGPLYVQQRLDNGETPLQIYNSDNTLIDSLYGKTYQGGLIASFNTSTGTGLITAPSDQSSYTIWGCNGVSITAAYNTAIGTGATNTAEILALCNANPIAAQVCNDLNLNGYTDWHLPSKDELNELYLHYTVLNFPGGTQTYWSSTEYNSINAWRHNFNNNFVGGYGKTIAARVRAVRYY